MLRAMRAEKSVGSASASSSALVCSDWVWPWVAAMRLDAGADDVVVDVLRGRATSREVWQWVRRASDLGSFGVELA